MKPSARLIRLLHLEDSPRSAQLVQEVFNTAAGNYELVAVADRNQFEEALQQPGIDLILCGFNLPDFDGLSALKLAKEKYPEIPVIIVSKAINSEEAVRCLKAGATDYLLSHQLDRLPAAVGRALKEARISKERGEMEARLRESEARFRAVVENLGDGLVLTDLEDIILDVNPRLTELTGYTREEVVGHHGYEVLNDSGQVEEMKRHNADRAGGRTSSYETRLRRKDGSVFAAEVTGAPLRNSRGEIFGTVGVIRDITERKRAQEALRESEQFTRASLDSLTTHIAVLEPDGTILTTNESWRHFALANGLDWHQVSEGVNYLEVCDRAGGNFSDAAKEIAAGIRDVMAGRRRDLVIEYPCHSPIENRWFLCRVTRFPGYSPTRVVVAHENITVRKAAELQALRTEKQFHDLFEFAPDAILMTNATGIITLVNRQAGRLFGYERGELVGRPVEILMPESTRPGHVGLREQYLAGAVPRTMGAGRSNLQGRKKDGTVFPVEISLSPMESDGGRLVVAAVRDVTERQRATETLERTARELAAAKAALEVERAHLAERVVERTAALSVANSELEHANRLKSEFLANMSHELRTPLNAILGLSEAMLDEVGGSLTPRQSRSVSTIHTSGQHLLALINDILDLSKVEAGKLELHPEQVNVEELCQTSLGFVRTQAMKKGIHVAFENDRPLVNIQADPKRLKQILVNLLTNAVKFTPKGGSIGLTVTAPPGDGLACFTVWDTGIGITQENAARLFQPFTQIDSGLSRAQEGTGLGLALVAKLTDMHGGSVSLESEPGRGSRFTVTLPLPPDVNSSATPPPRKFLRAVIVEDDPEMGALLARYLSDQAFRSILLGRGEEAMDAILRERPDVVLLDIELPGESGWEVLKRVKAHPQTHDIPVLVVSGVDRPEESQALGAAAHLTKPFTKANFTKFIKHAVGRKILPPVPAAPPPTGTGPFVLLAEDNEANIETIRGYLEEKGCQVRVAVNGLEALQSARELRPILVLMDIQMPVMDGLTAIRQMREDPALKNIPILALTGLAMPGDRERCLAAGANDYLSKPVRLRELEEHIRRILNVHVAG